MQKSIKAGTKEEKTWMLYLRQKLSSLIFNVTFIHLIDFLPERQTLPSFPPPYLLPWTLSSSIQSTQVHE